MRRIRPRLRPRTQVELAAWSDAPKPLEVRLKVSIDHNHCHRFAICQQEAPGVFELTVDGRLAYSALPDPRRLEAIRRAARLCPMQAITVREVRP